jgi:hypothetical protein
MESPDELKAHQRMEKDKGKVGFGKVESPYEIQEELIKKGGKGNVPRVELPGKLRERL